MAIGPGPDAGPSTSRSTSTQPYRSTSSAPFWRRWHMTLSRFLRDYVYIPLGGSREGTARYLFARALSPWVCAGCGTAPGWTFVAMGCFGMASALARLPGSGSDAQAAACRLLLALVSDVSVRRRCSVRPLPRDRSCQRRRLPAAWSGSTALRRAGGACPPRRPSPLPARLSPQSLTREGGTVDRGCAAARLGSRLRRGGLLRRRCLIGAGQPKSFIYFQF